MISRPKGLSPALPPAVYPDQERPALHFNSWLAAGPPLLALLVLATPYLALDDALEALNVMWRPIVAITSIMVITAGAGRLGVLERIAAVLFPKARRSSSRLFFLVFALSAATSAILNNDSAVLLLVPIVVPLVDRLYPGKPHMLAPFAFAVFMAAGVAPLIVSNPMNMIVGEFAGMSFNYYALRMLPISAVGWVVTYFLLKWAFLGSLRSEAPVQEPPPPPGPWTKAQVSSLALLLTLLVAYPIASYLGAPIWLVAAGGALVTIILTSTQGQGSAKDIARFDISWDILLFLAGLSVVSVAIRNAGLADWLADLYEKGGNVVVAAASMVGSALINNHPMSFLNISALRPHPGGDVKPILAALIGGDLGPRLLPIGSLAGLLWFSSLARLGAHIPVSTFCRIGALVTIPTAAASLAILALYR